MLDSRLQRTRMARTKLVDAPFRIADDTHFRRAAHQRVGEFEYQKQNDRPHLLHQASDKGTATPAVVGLVINTRSMHLQVSPPLRFLLVRVGVRQRSDQTECASVTLAPAAVAHQSFVSIGAGGMRVEFEAVDICAAHFDLQLVSRAGHTPVVGQIDGRIDRIVQHTRSNVFDFD